MDRRLQVRKKNKLGRTHQQTIQQTDMRVHRKTAGTKNNYLCPYPAVSTPDNSNHLAGVITFPFDMKDAICCIHYILYDPIAFFKCLKNWTFS